MANNGLAMAELKGGGSSARLASIRLWLNVQDLYAPSAPLAQLANEARLPAAAAAAAASAASAAAVSSILSRPHHAYAR